MRGTCSSYLLEGMMRRNRKQIQNETVNKYKNETVNKYKMKPKTNTK